MEKKIYQTMKDSSEAKRKQFALLLDPDKISPENIDELISQAIETAVDYIFFGGSLLTSDTIDESICYIKSKCSIPIVLFPGNPTQVNKNADGLFFLSLISGRNPELLIGHHVLSAPIIKQSGLEVIPTGYILIDGGKITSVSYISNTTPIPANKPDIAGCTAMAGQMLGMKVMYMDAGSGADNPIPAKVISAVKQGANDCPVVVGGGIRTPEQAIIAANAGADIIVVGNAIEKDKDLLKTICRAVHQLNEKIVQ